MVNGISESCYFKVLVRQSICTKKSLSKEFYAKQRRKPPCNELLVTVDNSGQSILVILLKLGKLRLTVFPLMLALDKLLLLLIFTS